MSSYLSDPAMAGLFKEIVKEQGKHFTGHLERDKKQALAQIEEHSSRLAKARIFLLDGKVDPSDYKIIKSEAEDAIAKLEASVLDQTANLKNITGILERAVDTLANLGKLYREGNTAEKRAIIGSIFPERLYFEEDAYRTVKMNEGVMLIYQIINGLNAQKKRTSVSKIRLSNW